MAYTKPYLTLPQQLALLESRGMVISDRPRAEAALHRIGYYRLSGYWYPFRQIFRDSNGAVIIGPDGNVARDNIFVPGTDFATVVNLYVFDKKLRLLFLDALERVEIALRVQIALLLGRYSALGHRDPANFEGFFSRRRDRRTGVVPHQIWLARTDDAFDKSREEFAKHFRTKYPGEHPPIWIASELWDFGATSTLFAGLRKTDQRQIAQEYGAVTFTMMESWIRALNVVRNVSAHHSRLWNRPMALQPQWPVVGAISDLDHLSGLPKAQARVYGAAALIRFMLRSINPTTEWGERVKDLAGTFPAHSSLSLLAAGFPSNWANEALWN